MNLVNVSHADLSKEHQSTNCMWFSWYPSELNLLTGVAAILTYPLDVEVVEMEEREEEERLKNEKADKAHAAEMEE